MKSSCIIAVLYQFLVVATLAPVSLAFMVMPISSLTVSRSKSASSSSKSSSCLHVGPLEEDDVDRELAKARLLLIEAKKQIAAMDAGEEYIRPSERDQTADTDTPNVPFFATLHDTGMQNKRDIVIKSRNDDGLITVNGEEMAKLSEEEMWSARPLGEVFENELNEDEDVYALATESLRQRDVAASIFNLRKSMQPQDYQKIFDKKNYFIGEDV
ncbi:hypothetical protein MHU86_7203 [Fragilaria crotonensis]|nr:hypothetical protein MHU86_7203 [Fragilaria crotonensis]